MTHLIITNEDGESLGIEQDTLLLQCVALGLTGDAAAQMAIRSLAAAAARMLLALSALKQDKGSDEKRRLYLEAERNLERLAEPVLRAPAQTLQPKRQLPVAQCRSCQARIKWLSTAAGKIIPVDEGTLSYGDETFDPKRHTAHFATCPNADQHRQNKKAGAAARQ